jgi:hypothetical protein
MVALELNVSYSGTDTKKTLEMGFEDHYFGFTIHGDVVTIVNIPTGTHTINIDTFARTIKITSGTIYNVVPDETKKIVAPKNKPYYRNLNPRKKQW